jgi:hypothetical protein
MSVSITSISISISISSSSSSGSGGGIGGSNSSSSRGSKAMFLIQLRHVNKHTNKYPSSAVCLIKTLTAATCFDPC